MEGDRSVEREELGLLAFIRSSPELSEFINQPLDQGLDDARREKLVQKRLKLLRPYASNPDIHEAIRSDFKEALALTKTLPGLLAKLLSSKSSLEANQFSKPDIMLLAGAAIERQYEKAGIPQLWDDSANEVVAVLHQAVESDDGQNIIEVVGSMRPEESKTSSTTRMVLASSIMMCYQQIRNFQDMKLVLSELVPIYDSLFYEGVLNGIGGRHQKKIIKDKIMETSLSIALDELIPGIGLVKELAGLVSDLMNLETIFANDARNVAAISKYLKSYLQALRIVWTLVSTFAEVNMGTTNALAEVLGVDLSAGEQA